MFPYLQLKVHVFYIVSFDREHYVPGFKTNIQDLLFKVVTKTADLPVRVVSASGIPIDPSTWASLPAASGLPIILRWCSCWKSRLTFFVAARSHQIGN